MHGTGNPGFCCKNNNLQGDRDELRTSGASPIFGRHRVALGCSGLHANCYFTAERNSPAPKNNNNNNNYYYYYDEIAPPYVTTTPFWL